MNIRLKEKMDNDRKRRQDRKVYIEKIKVLLSDEVFIQKSRRKYWFRLVIYSLTGLVLIFLSVSSYPYLASANKYMALFTSFVFLILSFIVLEKSRRCGACNGEVASGPAYCYDCGLTYWLHRQGRVAYQKRLNRIKTDKAQAIDAIIVKDREKNKDLYEFLNKAEQVRKIKDPLKQDDEIVNLENNFANKKN